MFFKNFKNERLIFAQIYKCNNTTTNTQRDWQHIPWKFPFKNLFKLLLINANISKKYNGLTLFTWLNKHIFFSNSLKFRPVLKNNNANNKKMAYGYALSCKRFCRSVIENFLEKIQFCRLEKKNQWCIFQRLNIAFFNNDHVKRRTKNRIKQRQVLILISIFHFKIYKTQLSQYSLYVI